MTMSDATWATGLLVYAPWIILVVGGTLVMVMMVVGSMVFWSGIRGGMRNLNRSMEAEDWRYRMIGGMYHALQQTNTALTRIEQRIAAIEQHAAYERETRTILLERLTPRTRASRKSPPSRVRGDEE